jgi:hypothetical protein
MTTSPAGPLPESSLTPAQLAARVERIAADTREVAAAMNAGVLIDCADSALPELALGLLAACDAAEAAATVTVGRVHTSGVLRADGVVSTKRWLQNRARCSERRAGAVLARARDLDAPEHAPTRSAWLTGAMTGEHTRETCLGLRHGEAKARSFREPWALQALQMVQGQMQDALLDLATDRSPEDVKAAAARLLTAIDPDGASEEAMAAHDAQALRITRVGDEYAVRGGLDTENGVALITVLDRIIDSWHRDGTLDPDPILDPDTGLIDAEATAKAGERHLGQPGRREHHLALALGHLARQYLDHGMVGVGHGARPHLTLTADLTDLLTSTGMAEVLVPGSDQPALVPMSTLQRLGCDAGLTLAITHTRQQHTGSGGCPAFRAGSPRHSHGNPGGGPATVSPALLDKLADQLRHASREVLWLGRTRRNVNRRLWNYLVQRDQHCRFPGCRVDVSRCQPHHVTYWFLDGPTDPDNLVMLCARHHRMVHEGGWRIHARADTPCGDPDYWQFNRPTRRPMRR